MLEQIIDFLTTTHGSGRREFYGWVWVLGLVVIPAVTAIHMRERHDRRKRSIDSTKKKLSLEHIRAKIIIEKDGVSKVIESEIRTINGVYELVLSEKKTIATSRKNIHSQQLKSWGSFLRQILAYVSVIIKMANHHSSGSG